MFNTENENTEIVLKIIGTVMSHHEIGTSGSLNTYLLKDAEESKSASSLGQ